MNRRRFLEKTQSGPQGFALRIGVLAALAIAFAFASYAGGKPSYLPLHVRVGEKAPDFTLLNANGKPIRLSSFRGHNVLLDFYEGYW